MHFSILLFFFFAEREIAVDLIDSVSFLEFGIWKRKKIVGKKQPKKKKEK